MTMSNSSEDKETRQDLEVNIWNIRHVSRIQAEN